MCLVKARVFRKWLWYNSSTQKHESQVEKFLQAVACSWKGFLEMRLSGNPPLSSKEIFNMTSGNLPTCMSSHFYKVYLDWQLQLNTVQLQNSCLYQCPYQWQWSAARFGPMNDAIVLHRWLTVIDHWDQHRDLKAPPPSVNFAGFAVALKKSQFWFINTARIDFWNATDGG